MTPVRVLTTVSSAGFFRTPQVHTKTGMPLRCPAELHYCKPHSSFQYFLTLILSHGIFLIFFSAFPIIWLLKDEFYFQHFFWSMNELRCHVYYSQCANQPSFWVGAQHSHTFSFSRQLSPET